MSMLAEEDSSDEMECILSSSSSSSSEDEERLLKNEKVQEFFETVRSYKEEQFQQHFRLKRHCVETLIGTIFI